LIKQIILNFRITEELTRLVSVSKAKFRVKTKETENFIKAKIQEYEMTETYKYKSLPELRSILYHGERFPRGYQRILHNLKRSKKYHAHKVC
jgi:hypothetical protein